MLPGVLQATRLQLHLGDHLESHPNGFVSSAGVPYLYHPKSMSFTASNVRRVLYEGGPAHFLYSIGNTPAHAVLPAGTTTLAETIKVCALCGWC